MARSSWKGPFVAPSLYKKVVRAKSSGSMIPIQTWSRSSDIIPHFVGLNFRVHNGKTFIPVSVSEEMVGHKMGEFSHTRTFYGHGADRKIKRKK